MKRHITKLEQRLIDSGFVLKEKHYYGKHSEKTKNYVYKGVVYCLLNDKRHIYVRVDVYLNSKRDKVDELYMLNPFIYDQEINLKSIEGLHEMADICEEQVKRIVYGGESNTNQEEQLEIAECVECENE